MIFAIGDIHGRADLLKPALEEIERLIGQGQPEPEEWQSLEEQLEEVQTQKAGDNGEHV